MQKRWAAGSILQKTKTLNKHKLYSIKDNLHLKHSGVNGQLRNVQEKHELNRITNLKMNFIFIHMKLKREILPHNLYMSLDLHYSDISGKGPITRRNVIEHKMAKTAKILCIQR